MNADGREELRERVRADESPPTTASVVIRGGPDTLSLLRTHARRLSRLYVLDGQPVVGISVFVATDDRGPASEAGILGTKLRCYPTVYRTTVAAILSAGCSLLPTFGRPHYTVILPALEHVDSLAAALGSLLPNPYAQR